MEGWGADGRPVLCARAVMVAGAGAASWRRWRVAAARMRRAKGGGVGVDDVV